jgi:hypothetical protein
MQKFIDFEKSLQKVIRFESKSYEAQVKKKMNPSLQKVLNSNVK